MTMFDQITACISVHITGKIMSVESSIRINSSLLIVKLDVLNAKRNDTTLYE